MTKSKNTRTTIADVVNNRSKRGLRQSIRGQLGNSTVLKGTELLTPITLTTGSTGGSAYYPLIAGSSVGRAVYTFINVSKNFQKFLYLPGTHIRYQPNVGLNANGTVYIAYIDNPESIKEYSALTGSSRVDFVKGQANMRSYPVWQEFIHHIGSSRLKTYATDVTTDFGDADTLNRVCQGCFVLGIDGVGTVAADTTFGRLALTNNLRLEELSASPVS